MLIVTNHSAVHDRIDGDEIALTHEFMSMMISADRGGVTVTLHILEGAGMIRSKRGRVIIRDRDKLEELAGDSYGVPEAKYQTLCMDRSLPGVEHVRCPDRCLFYSS
jgi:hypothetical protein